MANNFSGDSNCVALWKFDNNADDSQGGNDLTEVNSPSYDSGDKKEGTHCIDLEKDSVQYCTIADSALDSGFPGKSGTGEQSFSICAWFKLESIGASYQCIVGKFVYSGGLMSFNVVINTSGYPCFYVGYNSGANFSYITFDTAVTTGKWYHIGVVYDAADNGMKLRVWDDDAGVLLDDNKEGTAGGDMSPDTAALEIGRHQMNDSYVFDGKIDEVVFFNKVLSDDDIDAIRAGSYGATVTEKNATDTGSSVDAVESLQTPQAKTSSDSGSGVESTPIASAILTGNESGTAVDAVESLQTPQAKTSSDVGSGLEGTPTQSATLAGSEGGSALEALISRLLAGEEEGSAIEASSLDTGGLENLFADESAEGADRLVARIEMPTKGGGMKLWT